MVMWVEVWELDVMIERAGDFAVAMGWIGVRGAFEALLEIWTAMERALVRELVKLNAVVVRVGI